MKQNINGTRVRQAYEPVKVKVTRITPHGVLCQSGGGDGLYGTPQKYSGSAF